MGALTTAAGDDRRSAELLGADEDAGVVIDADSDEGPTEVEEAEDEEEDDDSDAVDDPPECSALDPLEI